MPFIFLIAALSVVFRIPRNVDGRGHLFTANEDLVVCLCQ